MAEEHIPKTDRALHSERDAHDQPRTGAEQTANVHAGAGNTYGDIESAQKHGDHQKKLKVLVGNETAEFIHGRNYTFLCMPGIAGRCKHCCVFSVWYTAASEGKVVYRKTEASPEYPEKDTIVYAHYGPNVATVDERLVWDIIPKVETLYDKSY